ncbi:MAG TPA: FAD-dependent monooxygenase, partial [Allocoleopsis sp.]
MDTKISGSRRRFLQNAALLGAGLSVPFIADKVSGQTGPTPVNVDCLIIGTGFGGAVAALRLAQAGITVTMLERGRRWTRDTKGEYPEFSNFRNPTNRIGWMRTNTPVSGFGFGRGTNGADLPADNNFAKYAGIFERIDNQPTEITGVHKVAATGIVSLGGSGVGGGSLIYNAISYKPPKELFELVFPKVISYNEMDTIYYPRVRAILKPGPTPFDILNTPYYAATRAALELGKASGLPTQLLDLDIDWSKVREELNGTRTKSAIIGDTWFGIKSGAKNSLDQNYLKMAEDTGKVTIMPLHIVYDIEAVTESGKQRYVVRCKRIDENGVVQEDKAYRCRLLFMG